jgi:hypothetical protein
MGSHVNVGCCVALDPSHGDLGYGSQGESEPILKNMANWIRKRNREIGYMRSGGDTGTGCYHFGELGQSDKLFVRKEVGERA